MTARRRNDAGVAAVWTAVVAGSALLVVGLVHDGGTILRARSATFDHAAGAARAAAQHLDQEALVDGRIELDPAAASTAGHEWLAARDATGEITVTDDEVTVTVHRNVQLQILQPASVNVTETATVEAHHGRSGP